MTPLPPVHRRALLLAAPALACLLIAACHDRADAPLPARASATRAANPATPPARPKDELETTASHVIGISYPPGLERYPALATEAQRYASQARQQLLDAAKQRPPSAQDGPYELSLEFKLDHESPEMVVLAVDGSAYTGGAHGTPLIQRWVWLPPQNRRLTVADLFPQPASWQRIAGEVRAQLRSELELRLDADNATPAERAAATKSAAPMIEGGTEPDPGDFAVFEPVLDGGGKITALRFVFPPYQMGSYADGMRTVELPAARLVQDVAPAYRPLFAITG
ncbi:DUF3298 and DUF4163 domain-containing protein [Cognatilysobacter lacus]|uniref:DUF4163 domain-containing protein n=1 Tax=Cognatilysobacter lacus TaxID=1643323 RepID=A0A5D8YY88_9GAMM|nr:DUF3298 and DUF4163 domain-containing protein [Lysobacter lacus]TZF87695.1 DUF4163 domain-containing protein [Lysobacter lacus]